MEIAIAKDDLINKVSEQYRPYILAMRTPDLKSQSPESNYRAIYDSIVIACEYSGSAKSEENGATAAIAENLLKELWVKYRFVRHGEILLALKKGILKEYGEYFGINVQTTYNWVKKYLDSKELRAAKLEWESVMEISTSDKTKANVLEVTDKQIMDVFNDYLATNHIPVYARVYYDGICKKKGIKTLIESQEQKLKIEKEAKLYYERDLQSKKTHTKEPDLYKQLLESFDRKSKTFQSVAKRIALKHYFDACKLTNKLPI